MAVFLSIWEKRRRELIITILILLSAGAFAYLITSHDWISYLQQQGQNEISYEELALLSRNQFIGVIYCVMYLGFSLLFLGHVWKEQFDYKWLLLMAHAMLGIFGCLGNAVVSSEQSEFLQLLVSGYYALAPVPLFLYLAFMMKKCRNWFVPLILMYCICSSAYLILVSFSAGSAVSAVAYDMSTGTFYVTLLGLIVMSLLERRAGNLKMKQLTKICTISLAGFVVLVDISFISGQYREAGNTFYYFWKFALTGDFEGLRTFYVQWMLAIVCMVYVAIDYIGKWYGEWMSFRLMKVRMESAVEYADKSNQYAEEVRRIKHDIQKHLSVLHMYLQEEKNAEAVNYLDSLELELQAAVAQIHCQNILINFLVEKYRKKAEQMGVIFTADIRLPEKIGVEETDICSLLDNMLENAIEGSSHVEKGTGDIHLKMYLEKDVLRIRCSNLFQGQLEQQDGRYKTTKENKSVHGYGLQIMDKICEKYGGALSVQAENNRFCVNAAVPEQENANLDTEA